MKFQGNLMHLGAEERGVFVDEDENFAAFTIHLQEINVGYLVLLQKMLEGDGRYCQRFPLHIILRSIRVGFDNFAPTRCVTVATYLQQGGAVRRGNGVGLEGEVGM